MKITPADEKLLAEKQAEVRNRLESEEPDLEKMRIGGASPAVVPDGGKRVRTPEDIQRAKANSARRAREARERERLDRLHTRMYRLASDTGSRLDPIRQTTLANYKVLNSGMAGVVQMIQEYLDSLADNVSRGNGIILIGRQGTGKDHLCLAVARQAIIECDVSARWVYGPELCALSRDIACGRASEHKVDNYKAAGVLILSDPVNPNVAVPEHYHQLLSRMLDVRNGQRRPTFITSNCLYLNASDKAKAKGVPADPTFESLLGSQLYSRVQQGAVKYKCTWDDWREREAT